MTKNLRKYKTFASARAEIFTPSEADVSVSQDTIFKSIGKKIDQVDLLYVKSVLVTTGINGNDDVFLVDEMWKARNTPVLKPFNWMHNEENIIGVMYATSCRDLNGKSIATDEYNAPFEIVTEGAIYKLIFPEKAEEIESKAKAGKLFVSMESWFDDYDYAFFNGDKFEKLIQRDSSTAFLDSYLRAKGGNGKIDVEGTTYRIGRVLRNLTFGGCGFVWTPANQRSDILEVGDSGADTDSPAANVVVSNDAESFLESILCTANSKLKLNNVVFSSVNKEEKMSDSKELSLTRGDLHATVQNALEDREKAQAAKAEVDGLKVRAEQLVAEKDKLTQANTALNDQVKTLIAEIDEQREAVNELVDSLAEAFSEAPPEIAKIDSVTDGDSAFKAKISWIQESMASLIVKACAATKLEADLAQVRARAREEEVAKLLGGLNLSESNMKIFKDKAVRMDDVTYAEWFAEKQILLGLHVSAESEGKESYQQDDFGNDVQVGKGPGSFPRTPRQKISGSNADKILDNVEVEKGVNLSGATTVNANDEDPIGKEAKSLAELIYTPKAKTKVSAQVEEEV